MWTDQPRSVQAYLDRCFKTIKLSSSSSLQKLVEGSAVLDAIRSPALIPLGLAMNVVPFTGNHSLYEPARTTACLAYRRAVLDGSDAVAELEGLVALTEGGIAAARELEPVQLRLRGGLLRTPPGAADFVTGKQLIPSRAGQMHELAFMWVLGGSATWPRDRLDAAINTFETEISEALR